jgi:signal transduction histidine kinase
MTEAKKVGLKGRPLSGVLFMWGVVLPVAVGLSVGGYLNRGSLLNLNLLFWAAVIAMVELLPVPVSKILQLSLSFPILLGVAILYTPVVAAIVAFVGSFDPREIRRELPLLTALFNRSQVALSVMLASWTFHSLASVRSSLYWLIPALVIASTASYCVNTVLVASYMRLLYRMSFRLVLSQLRFGARSQFLLNYLGLGLVGAVIARLYVYSDVRWLSVAAFILPLVFARQMFFRNLALEEATKELKDREQVLRALSNRMAEERQDERMQIAAYLHDDLAQMIFRLTLQVEMAKKRLAQGDSDAVLRDLDGISMTKQETSDAIRALIRDLHRSPIGRKGLAEAIQSFGEDMTRGHPTHVQTEVIEVSLPPPIQLLIYQIAREATMNALKHAEASTIRISLEEIEDGVKLLITDDGKGFDTSAAPPEGHFGSVMMRERAMVARGSYLIESEMGKGTKITVTFPRVWVEEGSRLEADAELAEGSGRPPPVPRPPVGSTVGPPRATAHIPDGDRQRTRPSVPQEQSSSQPDESASEVDEPTPVGGKGSPTSRDPQPTWPERPAVPA